jgi:ornithine cyclodeaminase/alanine dehydrogenase
MPPPPTTLVLTHADVRRLLDMDLAVAAVEDAFRALGEGRARMPPKVYLDLPEFDGDFRAMPAGLGDVAGVKWVNAHPRNRERHGLPTVLGVYVLSDARTALPLAVMDATLLTAFRTGAAGAVATRHLARPGFARVGFVGCGVQARMLRDAHRTLGAFAVLAADRDPAVAEAFARESGGRAVAVEEAAACEVVCVATPSTTPVLRRAWIRSGTHLNAMGADAPGKQELDPQILRDAHVVVDDRAQALHGGEVNVPLRAGLLDPGDIVATLGEVIAGLKPGRLGDEITVFDSTGLAVQDVALARAVYERARGRGVGLAIELVPAR